MGRDNRLIVLFKEKTYRRKLLWRAGASFLSTRRSKGKNKNRETALRRGRRDAEFTEKKGKAKRCGHRIGGDFCGGRRLRPWLFSVRAGRGGASPSPTVGVESPAGSVERQTVDWKAFGNEGKKPLRLGLIIGIANDPDAAMAKVHELGLPTCQALLRGSLRPDWRGSLTAALDEIRDSGDVGCGWRAG